MIAGEENKEFGNGKLYKITQNIYWFFATNVSFVLSNLLFFIFILFLERDFSNISLYLLGLVPTGPAISAVIASAIKANDENDYSQPVKDFVHYYKQNLRDSLKIWLPFLLILFVLLTDIAYFYQAGNGLFSLFFFLLAVLLIAFLLPIFLISSKFRFKLKDLLKLGAFYSLTKLKITIGNLASLFILFALAYYTSELIFLFISSLVMYFFVGYNSSIIKEVKENYTKGE